MDMNIISNIYYFYVYEPFCHTEKIIIVFLINLTVKFIYTNTKYKKIENCKFEFISFQILRGLCILLS